MSNSRNRIYIGNIPYKISTEELRKAFGKFGTINHLQIITDPESGQPRGFGFVGFEEEQAPAMAIKEMDGIDFFSRCLVVREANDDKRRPS